MLSLYKLEIFNTVAMEGSFSKAARRLLLSQPAISQHVRDLEASLHSQLFNRGTQGVTLTPAGEVLLDYTRCILKMLAEAESALLSLGEHGRVQVSIGATPGAAVYLLPGWVREFYQRFQGAGASLHTDITNRIVADIRSQKLDIGFVEGEFKPEPPIRSLALQEIRLFVVVPAGHPWSSEEEISVQALEGQPFITRDRGSQTRSWIDQLFEKSGIRPPLIAEFDNPEAIKQAVASGLGITILPEWAINGGKQGNTRNEGEVHALRLKDFEMVRTLKLVWNENAPLQPVTRAFLSFLAEQYPVLGAFIAANDGVELALPRREEYRASRACRSD
jgi:DNA-binding transcriptional LysR family regulator